MEIPIVGWNQDHRLAHAGECLAYFHNAVLSDVLGWMRVPDADCRVNVLAAISAYTGGDGDAVLDRTRMVYDAFQRYLDRKYGV